MKLLVVNGSPRAGSSTEILAQEFARGFASVDVAANIVTVRLNDLSIIPCQSCGIDPSPLVCIYKDDLYPYLLHLKEADMVLVASPLFFDSVSAQTKLFIDRCNCFRPPRFKDGKVYFDTKGILQSKGAYILVGGAREKYEGAERVIGGFFVWCGIEKVGKLVYAHNEEQLGAVASDLTKLRECFELGASCARRAAK